MTDNAVPRSDTDELLHSVVAVARAIFGAGASAMFLLDNESDQLVFRAVAGMGEDVLVGSSFPSHFGVVGWVVGSGEAIVLDDLASNQACAGEIAELTGYRPEALMAAPLLCGREVLGLLVVLDPVPACRSNLSDLELLSLFAGQAAVALRVVSAHQAGDGGDRDARVQLLDEFREFLERTGD
jgi:GAF domain-containing protein